MCMTIHVAAFDVRAKTSALCYYRQSHQDDDCSYFFGGIVGSLADISTAYSSTFKYIIV